MTDGEVENRNRGELEREPSRRLLTQRQQALKRHADPIARQLKRSPDAEEEKRLNAEWNSTLEEIQRLDGLIETLPSGRSNLAGLLTLILIGFLLIVTWVLAVPLAHVWTRVHADTRVADISTSVSSVELFEGVRLQPDGFRLALGPEELSALEDLPDGSRIQVKSALLRSTAKNRELTIALEQSDPDWVWVTIFADEAEFTFQTLDPQDRSSLVQVEISGENHPEPIAKFGLRLADEWVWPDFHWDRFSTDRTARVGLTSERSDSGLRGGTVRIDESDRAVSLFPGSFLRITFGRDRAIIDRMLRTLIGSMQPERESDATPIAEERNSVVITPGQPILVSLSNYATDISVDRRSLIPTRLSYLYAGERLLFLISLLTGIAAIVFIGRQVKRGKL